MFNGERKKSHAFLLQLEIMFKSQPSRYGLDWAKVLFAISLLQGLVFNWIVPYLESKHPMTYSYAQFWEAFKKAFGNINSPRQAVHKIMVQTKLTVYNTVHIQISASCSGTKLGGAGCYEDILPGPK